MTAQMSTFLFDILEERLKCLGSPSEATVPLRILHFLRFVWSFLKALFKQSATGSYVLQYDLLFIAQQESWDCGIACCNMVLKWCDNQQASIDPTSAPGARPIWTIELFDLMYMKGIDVTMFTKCKGVNPSHTKLEWYANSTEAEFMNTQNCFDRATREHWPVHEKEVNLPLLRSIVSEEDTAVIVLVDVNTLYKNKCDDYSGHYIVLMDYLPLSDEFICLNPALRGGAVLVASQLVQQARNHPGTDQDLIVCRRRRPVAPPLS